MGAVPRSRRAVTARLEDEFERRGATAPKRHASAGLVRHSLVELVPAAPPAAQTAGNARYVLDIGGARLEFGDDVSVATLRRVLEVLRSC
jgi:hypothetical protein